MIKNLMTWVSSQKRWLKKYQGTVYSVSCRQLKCPPTKEQSVHAANVWWEAKQAELELTEKANVHPRSAEIVNALQDNMGVRFASSDQAMQAVSEIVLRTTSTGEHLPDWFHLAVLGEERMKAIQEGMEALQCGNVAKPGQADRTIAGQVEVWLGVLRSIVASKRMDAGRYGSYQRNILFFSEWAGGSQDIAILNAPKLEAFWSHLAVLVAERKYAPATAKMILMTARQFITRLAEHGLIPLPGNIRSKRFNFQDSVKNVERLTIPEVRELLANATERTKCYLLLMLNCGMTQSDVSELGREEVEWDKGTLTRPRSKTPRGPVVCYKLWPETLALLKRFKSKANVDNGRGGNRCLLSGEDKPLSLMWVEGEKMRRYDNIRTSFNTLFDKVKWNKPIKLIRKTSASELASDARFSGLVDIFLAHSPSSIADKHYVRLEANILDGALTWLRERYLS